MKKFTILLLSLIISGLCSFAQLNQKGGVPVGLIRGDKFVDVETNVFQPTSSVEQLVAEDALSAGKNGVPLRVGFSIPASISFFNEADYIVVDNQYIWQYRIATPNAKAISLIFSSLNLPEDARLFIYAPDGEVVLGYFDSESNTSDKPFVSQFIPGDELVVEVIANNKINLDESFYALEIEEIAYAYRDVYESIQPLDSDPCQVNINCPEGNNWRRQQRGIARMLFREGASWYYCTGSLVNNTAQDGTRYFLTAEHCGGEASAADRNVWQFIFRYERPDCTNSWGPINSSHITGCTLVSKGQLAGGSDFQLVTLNSAVPRSQLPYYNGWDRTIWASTSGVGIHHPSGDVKKISTYGTALVTATPNIGGSLMATSSAWRVIWMATETSHGVTEQGSSGSPIFNNNNRIIGTLSGGSSSCSTPTSPDFYGKFTYHWQSNGATNDKQLKPWLDPLDTDPTHLDGFDPLTPRGLGATVDLAQVQLSWSAPFTATGLSGYKVYQNEELVATLGSSVTNHTLNHTEIGSYQYYVTATFSTPAYESEPSNIVSANISGLSVTFDVKNTSGNAITDAIITFNSQTAEPGSYQFTVLQNGQFSFSVERDGFNTFNGNVNVSGENITQTVVLSMVNISPNADRSIQMYPNPFNEQIIIENAQQINRVTLVNIIGQEIMSEANSSSIIKLNTEKIKSGVYIVLLELQNGEKIVRRVVKN